ncbi:hypothetical protein Patl1_01206 [Pistacia atlantica]|uniref:Uncharacterized protein n=1 Tax=Pistacia atlantica TaxID=434234 RepID=A0ACC1CB87_9ROSI|nr:hypothetical protein Patl1_01206 [Pistacia atlantica]
MKDSIVIYPSPGRGHLVSMIKLAKLILTHYPSFSITVIIPEAPFETGSTYEYVESISATVPSVTFHHLPTIPTTTSLLDIQTQTFELSLQNNHNFHQALLLISKSSNIKALILDFFCNPFLKSLQNSKSPPTITSLGASAASLCFSTFQQFTRTPQRV